MGEDSGGTREDSGNMRQREDTGNPGELRDTGGSWETSGDSEDLEGCGGTSVNVTYSVKKSHRNESGFDRPSQTQCLISFVFCLQVHAKYHSMGSPSVPHQRRSVIECQGELTWFLLRVKEQGERDGQTDK